MARPLIVGFSGNPSRPSKTRGFVEHVVREIAQRQGYDAAVYDVADLGPSFRLADSADGLDRNAREIAAQVERAELLVVGSPTYKGSYTGLFKHFFDLLDPAALRCKPVLLTATGGGPRHALVVEHAMRPLFGFFEAFALPTAVYATDQDFRDGVPVSPPILARIGQATAEARRSLSHPAPFDIAAE